MSGYLPQGTTLQLSNTSGDISHQGVLASNLSGTINLLASSSNFPSTTTGSSVGHYHYTDASTKSLKFLNASGSGSGGHQFFNSSSTSAPVKTFEVTSTSAVLETQLKNSSNNTILNFVSNDLTLTNDLSQSFLNHEAFAFKSSGISNVQINNSSENPNVIFTSATHNSQLTANDLKFDGVSLPSSVSTNTLNIANNKILSTTTSSTYSSPAIYADASPPLPCPSTITNTNPYFGWYFRNIVSGSKVNWYIPPKNLTYKVSDLLGFYLKLFNVSTTSNDNTPFITVYTRADALTPNYSWYKSKNTYVITATPTINTNYTFLFKTASTPTPQAYNTTILALSPSTVNNPRGSYAQTEDILFFSIGSNSASTVGSVEFIAQKFGILCTDGTAEYELMPLIG